MRFSRMNGTQKVTPHSQSLAVQQSIRSAPAVGQHMFTMPATVVVDETVSTCLPTARPSESKTMYSNLQSPSPSIMKPAKKRRVPVFLKCPNPLGGQTRYWTASEHDLFLEAVKQFGEKSYVAISNFVETRTPRQVRTHAQKYWMKLIRTGVSPNVPPNARIEPLRKPIVRKEEPVSTTKTAMTASSEENSTLTPTMTPSISGKPKVPARQLKPRPIRLTNMSNVPESTPSQSLEGQTRYWTENEHDRFLKAVAQHGEKSYAAISKSVKTRTAKQVRTHAQKFHMKLIRLATKCTDNGQPFSLPEGMLPLHLPIASENIVRASSDDLVKRKGEGPCRRIEKHSKTSAGEIS